MKKLLIFTSTRADYGILSTLTKKLKANQSLNYEFLVTGSHTLASFGNTIAEIRNNKEPIFDICEFIVDSSTLKGQAKSFALASLSFSEVLSRKKFDAAVILGDRYEALAFAISCYMYSIPIIHLHGGELTYGSKDDGYRHSITKLATLHFTSTDNYKRRIIQMGENPKAVFNIGSVSVESIHKHKIDVSKNDCLDKLGLGSDQRYCMMTLHPETSSNSESSIKAINNCFNALEGFENICIVITGANFDTNGRLLNKFIKDKCIPRKIVFTESLGRENYFSTLFHSDFIIGNSSSGIIEAPSVAVPTVNIGERQKGREFGNTVINTSSSIIEIKNGIEKALELKELINRNKFICINPYYKDGGINLFIKTIEKFNFDKQKLFFDLEH